MHVYGLCIPHFLCLCSLIILTVFLLSHIKFLLTVMISLKLIITFTMVPSPIIIFSHCLNPFSTLLKFVDITFYISLNFSFSPYIYV